MIVNYIGSAILIALGLITVLTKKNLIKIIIGLGIMDYGINLLIVSFGFNGGTAPIFTIGELTSGMYFVDPVPQALTLTSIVIGACVDAMALAIVTMIHHRYGTVDADKIRRLNG